MALPGSGMLSQSALEMLRTFLTASGATGILYRVCVLKWEGIYK